MVCLPPVQGSRNREGEGDAGADLACRTIVHTRATQTEIECDIFFDLPDGPDQSGAGAELPEIPIVEELDATHRGEILAAQHAH
jgi:hypothetical protein